MTAASPRTANCLCGPFVREHDPTRGCHLVALPLGTSGHSPHSASPPHWDPRHTTSITMFSCPKAIRVLILLKIKNSDKHLKLSRIIPSQKVYVPNATCSLRPGFIEWLLTSTSLVGRLSLLPGVSQLDTFSTKPPLTHAAMQALSPRSPSHRLFWSKASHGGGKMHNI